MKTFYEWIGLPSRTTMTVKVTLVGDESSTYHDLQQDFLQGLPQKIGRATVYHAEIAEGEVDKDDVPRGRQIGR